MLYIIIVMYKYYYNMSNIFICNKGVRYKKQNVSGYLCGLLMEKAYLFNRQKQRNNPQAKQLQILYLK